MSHGKTISDGKDGNVDGIVFSQPCHFGKWTGISGHIQASLVGFDHEPTGIAAIGAIGKRGRVPSPGTGYPAPIQVNTTSGVDRLYIIVPQRALHVLRDLEVGHDKRTSTGSYLGGISPMIPVSMRYKNGIGPKCLRRRNRLGQGIARDEGINQDAVASSFQLER